MEPVNAYAACASGPTNAGTCHADNAAHSPIFREVPPLPHFGDECQDAKGDSAAPASASSCTARDGYWTPRRSNGSLESMPSSICSTRDDIDSSETDERDSSGEECPLPATASSQACPPDGSGARKPCNSPESWREDPTQLKQRSYDYTKKKVTKDDIIPEDWWSTIRMRVPKSDDRDKVVQKLKDAGLQGYFTFVYVPMDHKKRCAKGNDMGSAFVDFTSNLMAQVALEIFADSAWWSDPLQGYAQHVARYRGTDLMKDSVQDSFKPAIFDVEQGGRRVPFPEGQLTE